MNMPRCRRQDAGHHLAKRRLPAAGFTDNADNLALEDLERYVINSVNNFFAMILSKAVQEFRHKIERFDEVPRDIGHC